MTRTLPVATALVGVLVVAPTTARPPLPADSPRVLDLARHDSPSVRYISFPRSGSVVAVHGGRWEGDKYVPAITLWESATGRHLWTLRGPDAEADGFSFSPDGKHLALSSDGRGTVVIRDAGRGTELRRLTPAVSAGVGYSPDGKHLVTFCLHGPSRRVGLNVLDLATGRVVYDPVFGKDEPPRWFAFAADGRLFVATQSTRLRTWNPHTSAETVVQMDLPLFDVSGPDTAGTRVLRWGTETLRTIDVRTGQVLRQFGGEGEACGVAHLTADGAEVVSATKDGRVVCWDATTGAPRSVIQTSAGKNDRISISYPYLVHGRILVRRATPGARPESEENWLGVYTRDGRLIREDRNLTDVVFDAGGRWVAVRTDPPAAPGRPSRPTVTLHDAAAWLAGGAKN